MKNKKTNLMTFEEYRATLHEEISIIKKNKFNHEEVHNLINDLLNIKELKDAFYSEFKKIFLLEHDELLNSILENEKLLTHQELELKNYANKLEYIKDDIERTKLAEAYLNRNSISRSTSKNRSKDGSLKPLAESDKNDLENIDKENQLLGAEEIVVKQ